MAFENEEASKAWWRRMRLERELRARAEGRSRLFTSELGKFLQLVNVMLSQNYLDSGDSLYTLLAVLQSVDEKHPEAILILLLTEEKLKVDEKVGDVVNVIRDLSLNERERVTLGKKF